MALHWRVRGTPRRWAGSYEGQSRGREVAQNYGALISLAGWTAQSVLDEPLAEFPQGPSCLFALSLFRRQATATVVEIHPSEAFQLGCDCTVDSGSSSLLLKDRKERETLVFKNNVRI